MYLPAPYGLRDPALLAQRRDMLTSAAAAQPLLAWAHSCQQRRPGALCPHLDPAEAGVNARVLVLL